MRLLQQVRQLCRTAVSGMCCRREDGAVIAKRTTPSKRRPAWLTTLCVGLMLSGVHAGAATTIYLYDAYGNPSDVTASYRYQQNYLYDSLNNVVGTVDSSGRVFDASLQQIGYVTTTPGP